MTISVELRDEQAARLDRFATGLHKSRVVATDEDRVSQALRYAAAFESEVRRCALDENRAITPEKLRASLPSGAWVEIR